MMRRSGRAAFSPAITSKRFCPARVPSSTRSISFRGPNSARLHETNSRSVSVSNNDFNPINRNGSLSTTAMRIVLFDAPAFINAPSETVACYLCIVSKKWFARSESIMNLSPSPFPSRVHVLKLECKVQRFNLGVTCWLPAGQRPAGARIRPRGQVRSRDDSPRSISLGRGARLDWSGEAVSSLQNENRPVRWKSDRSHRVQNRRYSRQKSPGRSTCGADLRAREMRPERRPPLADYPLREKCVPDNHLCIRPSILPENRLQKPGADRIPKHSAFLRRAVLPAWHEVRGPY